MNDKHNHQQVRDVVETLISQKPSDFIHWLATFNATFNVTNLRPHAPNRQHLGYSFRGPATLHRQYQYLCPNWLPLSCLFVTEDPVTWDQHVINCNLSLTRVLCPLRDTRCEYHFVTTIGIDSAIWRHLLAKHDTELEELDIAMEEFDLLSPARADGDLSPLLGDKVDQSFLQLPLLPSYNASATEEDEDDDSGEPQAESAAASAAAEEEPQAIKRRKQNSSGQELCTLSRSEKGRSIEQPEQLRVVAGGEAEERHVLHLLLWCEEAYLSNSEKGR